MEQYYSECYKCEYLYHCFDRETIKKIKNDDTEDMYLRPDACHSYYPEI